MRSLLAGWRLSLHRTRADWPIVAAAWLITLLAAVLLAAGLIYPSAASEAGLRRALADAPVADVHVDVSRYGPSAGAAAIEERVHAELEGVIAPIGGSIVRDWRGSATLALPDLPAGQAGDQGILGSLDGLPDHATLVGGAWPAGAPGSTEPIQVVLVDAAARALGLRVGDVVALVAHPSSQPVTVPVRLVGTFAVNDEADPYWIEDEQLIAGIRENGQNRTFGPFVTTMHDLLARTGIDALRMQWHLFPNFVRLTVEDATQLRGRLEALPDRLVTVAGEDILVTTGLPAILRDSERSLLVSRTGVLLLMAQLAILAAYAIVLTASLLVDHRRMDTAMLRSRGAGPGQVALLATAEGILLAIPAVLVAPWLAVAALNVLNVAGPLADVGLRIEPRVTLDSYLAAGAAGLVCVALLALPAALAARGFAAEQSGLSRQETRTFGQRMGLDLALLAVTGIAIWQLRLYGAPLTRSVQGSLGLDPLLVAAPAIGLVAGGVLALRILPLLAEAVEAAVSRSRGLVATLGSRQLARRPLRYTRSALLLMLAMSMGVFALSYSATWGGSQRDQAAYQAGADVRVEPGEALGALPAWALPGAYARLAGVERASPAERITDGITFAAAGSADLLSLDADTAAGIVLFRPDESAQSLVEMMQALRAARPEPGLPTLHDGAAYLRILPRVDFNNLSRTIFDFTTGDVEFEPLDPADVVGIDVTVNAIVRDAHGLLYRIASGIVPVKGQPTAIVLPLMPVGVDADAATAAGITMDGPVELAALGIELFLPDETATSDAVIGVAEVAAGADPAGPWTDVTLASGGDWQARFARGRDVLVDVPGNEVRGTAVQLGGGTMQGDVYDPGDGSPATVLGFQPSLGATLDGAIPGIANRAFLAATGASPGETITATVADQVRSLEIIGVVDSFPTTDPDRPLLVIDAPTLGLLRLQGTSGTRSPDEWWLAAKDDAVESVTGALRGSPFESAAVLSAVDRARGLSTDPVALGIIGALALGFVATGLFAVVGLTVSASVSARQRRTEFALLRALGLSGRQLSSSLWLENGSLVVVSLLAGTGLGLLIGWMVLPFITVTQRATTPVPPVLMHVPWDRILLLDVVSAVALGLAVVVIGGVLRRLGVGSILRMGED